MTVTDEPVVEGFAITLQLDQLEVPAAEKRPYRASETTPVPPLSLTLYAILCVVAVVEAGRAVTAVEGAVRSQTVNAAAVCGLVSRLPAASTATVKNSYRPSPETEGDWLVLSPPPVPA